MKHENYDPYFPDQPVVDLYLSIWAKLPAFKSKPVFIWAEDGVGSSGLTYEELNSSVQCISSELLISLRRRDTVVILCSPGLELVEIIFACQRAGLLGVPIIPPDPAFGKDNFHHLVRVLSQTNPTAAIAQSDYIKNVRRYLCAPSRNRKLSGLLEKLKWIPVEEMKMKGKNSKYESDDSSYKGCRADDVYLIQYTSGTTGIPKPALVTAGAAAHNVRAARKAYDLHPESVIVSWLPQYHDCGLMFLLLTVVSGATCVLTSPNAFVRRPRIWLELISEYKATCTPVPSFALPVVVRRGGVKSVNDESIDFRNMKNLIIINEPIYSSGIQEFVEIFKPYGLDPATISPSYGLAENCTFVSTAWRASGNRDSPSNFSTFPTYKQLLPSARLPANTEEEDEEEIEILVVNQETEEPVEDGTEGEIWISSPSNASGYLHHTSLTREIFHARLRNRVRQCYVRTGDTGVVRGERRYLYVTGRCTDMIKFRDGKSFHPHYIEMAAYNSWPELLRGGCLAAFELSRTVAVVAELQRTEVGVESLAKVMEGMKEAVMRKENVAVGSVILVKSGSVPKTTSGKVQRWLAKHKLEKGEMRVITQTKFDDEGGQDLSLLQRNIMVQTREEEGEKGRRKESIKGRRNSVHGEAGNMIPNRGPLLSSL